MNEKNTKRRKRRRRRRGGTIWAVLMISLLIVLAAAAYLYLIGGADEQQATVPAVSAAPEITAEATQGVQLAIDPNAGELITPTPAPTEPGVAIPGWGSMTIPAGETEVATAMQNPEANEGWYYLTFELRLKDTDEVIFTTGLIPPGQYCNKVTLTRALEKGEYAAIVHVQPYRISDQSPTNNADMETVLIVE